MPVTPGLSGDPLAVIARTVRQLEEAAR